MYRLGLYPLVRIFVTFRSPLTEVEEVAEPMVVLPVLDVLISTEPFMEVLPITVRDPTSVFPIVVI